ncbi:MAG: MBL fold metallo-hydrolase, partial [Clostridia bacterium]|nr:MBL fold metallo-hydrolase [Clostridia bacterium]
MQITKDIRYIGVNDRTIDLFEGQYRVPNGMAYNSYLILDEKIAVMDTVDIHFTHEWLDNLSHALGGRTPDYLIVQHMEPDHSANIMQFLGVYPTAKIVSSAAAFRMMKQFFGKDLSEGGIVIADGDTLSLGKHNLVFASAPMVHWPEVMVTYDATDRVLFSADAFGKFGTTDADEDWACEARRYYFGIVGKYGAPAQALLKKAAALDISIICPLHGPVLTENLSYYINLYDTWSS